MDEKLKSEDRVLLTKDQDGNLKPVTGLDEKGNVKTVNPKQAKENDFIRVDKNGDLLENFFKNFLSQAKNPTHTGFYAMAVGAYYKLTGKENKDENLAQYRVNPEDFTKQKQEQTTEFKQFDTSRIPESEYQKYGITPQGIENELKAMSYGFKSPHLVDINPLVDNEPYSMKARLSLEEKPDGSLAFITYPYQNEVDLDKPIKGIFLPDDVKESLTQTGHGGKVIDLYLDSGEKVPSLVSIDKLTNRIESFPVEQLRVSQTIKGVELTKEQQESLKNGQKVLIEGMISKKTIDSDTPKKFDAYLQFNAAKGNFEFSYDGLKKKQDISEEQQNKVRIPSKLLGVELSEKQQNMLRENKSVYVQGMMKDGQDQPFNAYVKVNHEEGKLDFYKWNPDKAKKQGAEVKPAEGSKTQVAVNSEGKTNEATKNVKEPLKQGQQKPTEKQEQEQKVKNPRKKSAGQKL